MVVYEPEEVYNESLTDERGLVYGKSNGDGAHAPSLAQPSEATFGISRLKNSEQSHTISSWRESVKQDSTAKLTSAT